ncbi:protein MARD1-like [Phalaenopsis equestris]|uniref:protein MARD1-like n=1 Tax=Phalaenopsis equestris TaxID=78828 RepID=UPI0009E487A7|nr:protein MARD1-like [Phalaenopsis equestris]
MSLKVPMMMKRSTAINSKQALMSDHSSRSSHFPSPVLFMSFSDAETSKMEQTSEMSPTSILEVKSFSATKHHSWDLSNSKTVGLRILDDLIDDKIVRKPVIEFGVKNRSSQLAMASLLSPSRSSPEPPPPILCLSATEMEKSEDYTRVISHGPNPRTTHIFDTWIMENCGNGFNSLRKEIRISMDGASGDSSNDFLAFCNACKKNLGEGDDIFMFRFASILFIFFF